MTMPIVVLDLETTGLDILTVDPIEIGMLCITVDDDQIAEGPTFEALIPCPPIATWETGAAKMHSDSGLADLAETRSTSPVAAMEMRDDRRAVEQQALAWLDRVAGPGEVLACGNNVGRFDLVILRRTMPQLAARFFYRALDVSALKVAGVSLGWWREPPKVKTHRALEDCRASVAELRYYHQRARRRTSAGDWCGLDCGGADPDCEVHS